MSLPIPEISGLPQPAATGYVNGAGLIDELEPGAAASAGSASAFADTLGGVVDNTQQLKATSNELAIAAVSGDLADIHDATIAATRAQTTLETVAAVRNKVVDAFNEIMRMQA